MAYCFTIWRDRDGADDVIEKLKQMAPQYMCWAPETCEETGRPHYQLYVHWHRQLAASSMGRLVKDGLGWNRKAVGTAKHNRTYIFGPYDKDGKHKDANPEAQELGDMPIQGARNDIHPAGRAIRAGKRVRDLLDEEEHWGALAQYERFYKKLQFHTDRKTAIQQYRDGQKPFVTVLWGASGIGKTRRPWEIHGPDNVYEVPYTNTSCWFDHYDGESVLLFDDFTGEVSETLMFKICDRYPMKLAVKGDHVYRLATHIYITSELHPDYWYPNSRRQGLTRRIDRLIEVKPNPPPTDVSGAPNV